jgi:hypothetical protein
MIRITCPEYMEQVRAFAHSVNAQPALQTQLNYLAGYGDGNNICELYKDFAPHSFQFLMKHPDGSNWFNGGLIYNGPGVRLDGSFPALTVSLDTLNPDYDTEAHNWSVHT